MRTREVTQHQVSKKWAYVEFDSNGAGAVLGGKEFDTEEEAREYSKGFKSLFTYMWSDPNEVETNRRYCSSQNADYIETERTPQGNVRITVIDPKTSNSMAIVLTHSDAVDFASKLLTQSNAV